MADVVKGLNVPVTNVNFKPQDAPDVLEGFVPNTPRDDLMLQAIRVESQRQGLRDGGPDLSFPQPELVETPAFDEIVASKEKSTTTKGS